MIRSRGRFDLQSASPADFVQPQAARLGARHPGLDPDQLAGKVGMKSDRVGDWETTGRISIAQAEKVARFTYTPLGFLYLDVPPEDGCRIPISAPVVDDQASQPSPDLLETVYSLQRRQDWVRETSIGKGPTDLPLLAPVRLMLILLRSPTRSDPLLESD